MSIPSRSRTYSTKLYLEMRQSNTRNDGEISIPPLVRYAMHISTSNVRLYIYEAVCWRPLVGTNKTFEQ